MPLFTKAFAALSFDGGLLTWPSFTKVFKQDMTR